MQAAQAANTAGTNVLTDSTAEAQSYNTSAKVDSVGAQLQTIINGMEVFIYFHPEVLISGIKEMINGK